MTVLQPKDSESVSCRFAAELKNDVLLRLYTQFDIGLFIPGRECRTCSHTKELIQEVSALSPRITLEIIDYHKNLEEAANLGIDRIPAIVIVKGDLHNVRFFGMPSGFEFAVLLDSIIDSTKKKSSLQLDTRRHLKDLNEDVYIKVFVTPDCKYCPTVARLAHMMAIESPKVTADVIEVREFPDMASVYHVMGVPKTIINDSVTFTGPVTEEELLQRILESVGSAYPDENITGSDVNRTTPVG